MEHVFVGGAAELRMGVVPKSLPASHCLFCHRLVGAIGCCKSGETEHSGSSTKEALQPGAWHHAPNCPPQTLHRPPQPCLTSAQWGWSQARWPVFESSQSSGAGSRDMRLSPGASFYQGWGYRPTSSHWKSRSSVGAMVDIVLHVLLITSQLRRQKHKFPMRHQTAPGGYVVWHGERQFRDWNGGTHILDYTVPHVALLKRELKFFAQSFETKCIMAHPHPAPPGVCPFCRWSLLDITGAAIQKWTVRLAVLCTKIFLGF